MRTPLLLLALGLPTFLAAQSPSLAGMPFKGELLHQQRFTDNGGENVILISSIDHPKEQRNDIFAYQYRVVGGKPSLVWDIQDFSTPLCNMAVAEGSIQVIDLDQDGLCEVSLLYQQRCDGLDPYVTKLILHSKGKNTRSGASSRSRTAASSRKSPTPPMPAPPPPCATSSTPNGRNSRVRARS